MTIRPTRQILAGALCIAAGLVAALGPGDRSAHAAMTVSTDPVVALSNSIVFDLSTRLIDDGGLSDIQHISYRLHVPLAVRVIRMSYPDGTGALSGFTVDYNQAAGQYACDVVVTTKTANIPVTAFLGGVSLSASRVVGAYNVAQGRSGDDLQATLTLH